MIARLKGILEKSREGVVVDVQGVGYALHVPETVLARMPEVGSPVTLHVYTHVREDQISLFGFLSELEKDVFELLLGASGIGPKLALAILSALDAKQALEALATGNKAIFSGISGVGKKTVEKLFLEMSEKAGKRWALERGSSFAKSKSIEVSEGIIAWAADLEQALLALGYRDSDVQQAIRDTMRMDYSSFEPALKHALQLMSSSKSPGMRGFA